MQLTSLDISIIIIYAIGLLGLALWISREEKNHEKNTKDYFLASKSLPWWAVGASLIAANISAEQIIGMSGSGFALGLGIASYEWMAAITLLFVGKYFLPIFLKRGIYTMPQFLEQRFDNRVRTTMAVFWLGVYVLVNLTSILWLGGLAVETVTGVPAFYAMIFIALFSVAYSIYGGLKAVAFTDIIQVVLLVAGGFILSYFCLDAISNGRGVLVGYNVLLEKAPEKFDMILDKSHPNYIDLPGLSVLVGGLWVMNLSYWGFNQYIIQRALAAKNIYEAHKGIAFAAFLKILMPIIVVLPGICAFILQPDIKKPDMAYPEMMNLMPSGLKGLIFAALIAAIVSSVASMSNSISTIFTMDLYSQIKRDSSQRQYVAIGRLASVISLIIAVVVAKPLLAGFEQAFQYIQEFTGFFTPGICVIFLLGLFYKKTTANAALAAALGSAIFSLSLKLVFPELPFMDRVGIVFIACIVLAIIISQMGQANPEHKSVQINDISFQTQTQFNIASIASCLIIISLYVTWW